MRSLNLTGSPWSLPPFPTQKNLILSLSYASGFYLKSCTPHLTLQSHDGLFSDRTNFIFDKQQSLLSWAPQKAHWITTAYSVKMGMQIKTTTN